MSKQIAFGVGCFHFWLIKKPPFTLDLETYKKTLDETLQAIPTVTNIEIHSDEHDFPIVVTEELLDLHEGQFFLPHPSFMEITFDVYIPYRIQEKLFERETPLETFTENFRVEIHYAFHAPVCFVELLNPTKKGSPSEAIRLVRDYLEQEVRNVGTDIKFDVLGPSPFHADFYLLPRKKDEKTVEDQQRFEVNQVRKLGYDQVLISYREDSFTSIDDAKEELFSKIEDELGLFYQIVLFESKFICDWIQIQSIIDDLTDLQGKKKNRIQRFKNIFLRGRYINKLFTALVGFEAGEISARSSINKGYRDVYSKREQTFLQFYIDEELKQQPSYPTKQISDLAVFLENRRSKAIEMFIVLLSAIIGGIAGSLITIVLSQGT